MIMSRSLYAIELLGRAVVRQKKLRRRPDLVAAIADACQ
jgi:hypothetical protein